NTRFSRDWSSDVCSSDLRIWRKEEAPMGAFTLKQKGSEGMDVVSVLRVRHKDGKVESRSYRSKYYPVPEVFWLGEGTPLASLPEIGRASCREKEKYSW